MCHEHHDDPLLASRRQILKGFAGILGLAGIGLKGTVLATNMLIDETPSVTEGPYWVDEMLNRSDVRTDPATGVAQVGLQLNLTVRISQIVNGTVTPLVGAYVDIWHASALGVYSDIASENTSGQKFLRGYQVTDSNGMVEFITLYPGWYSGRTPHIHARVRVHDASTNTVTYNFITQFFFDDSTTNDVYANVSPYNTRGTRDTTNSTDSIYQGGSYNSVPTSDAGQYLLLALTEDHTLATGSFDIVLDLSDTANEDPTGGSETGTGTGGGPGGGTGTGPGGGTGTGTGSGTGTGTGTTTPRERARARAAARAAARAKARAAAAARRAAARAAAAARRAAHNG